MTTPQTSVESPIRKVSNGLIPQRELNGSRECDLNTRIRWVVLASFQSAVARPVGRRLRSVGLHWGFISVASCHACYFGAPKVGWNLWAFARALADARRTTVCFRFFGIWENSRGLKQCENFSPWYSKLCCTCRSVCSLCFYQFLKEGPLPILHESPTEWQVDNACPKATETSWRTWSMVSLCEPIAFANGEKCHGCLLSVHTLQECMASWAIWAGESKLKVHNGRTNLGQLLWQRVFFQSRSTVKFHLPQFLCIFTGKPPGARRRDCSIGRCLQQLHRIPPQVLLPTSTPLGAEKSWDIGRSSVQDMLPSSSDFYSFIFM